LKKKDRKWVGGKKKKRQKANSVREGGDVIPRTERKKNKKKGEKERVGPQGSKGEESW